MNLPSSDSVLIPMTGASSIDIEVPGDGKTVRGAYLDWMTSSEVVHPVNAEHRDVIPEPFSSVPTLHPPPDDLENFGTVTATLAAETIRIDAQSQEGAAFQFPIETQPLTALLTFEIANPRIDAPPEIYLNGQDIGPASLTLPDLGDPAYRGEAEPLSTQMRFNYTGWVRAQNGRVTPLSRGKNEKKTTGLHAARDHARGEHYRDHIGSGDFKTWQHHCHRKSDAGSSRRAGDQNAIAAV